MREHPGLGTLDGLERKSLRASTLETLGRGPRASTLDRPSKKAAGGALFPATTSIFPVATEEVAAEPRGLPRWTVCLCLCTPTPSL